MYLHRKINEIHSTYTCLAYRSVNDTIQLDEKQECGQVPSLLVLFLL